MRRFELSPATLIAVSLMALLVCAAPGVAQGPPAGGPGNPPEHAGPPQGVVDDLLARGFDRVEPSIFQRPEPSGSYETIAFGSEGLLWLLRLQDAQLQALEARQAENPLPELADAIVAQQALIRRTADQVQAARLAENPSASRVNPWEARHPADVENLRNLTAEAAVACTTTVSRSADARPGSGGPEAQGSASFTETCGDYGETYVYTYAEGTAGGTHTGTFQECTDNGLGGSSCSALASVPGTSGCYSFAQAQAQIYYATGVVTWAVTDTNFVCQKVAVSMTGPTSIFVPYNSCAIRSWSASASQGTSPYTYQWRYNGLAVSNSTSYSRSYCNYTGSGAIFNDNISVTATDGTGDTASASKSVRVTFEYNGGCLEPCICPLEATKSSPAASVSGMTSITANVVPCY